MLHGSLWGSLVSLRDFMRVVFMYVWSLRVADAEKIVVRARMNAAAAAAEVNAADIADRTLAELVDASERAADYLKRVEISAADDSAEGAAAAYFEKVVRRGR